MLPDWRDSGPGKLRAEDAIEDARSNCEPETNPAAAHAANPIDC